MSISTRLSSILASNEVPETYTKQLPEFIARHGECARANQLYSSVVVKETFDALWLNWSQEHDGEDQGAFLRALCTDLDGRCFRDTTRFRYRFMLFWCLVTSRWTIRFSEKVEHTAGSVEYVTMLAHEIFERFPSSNVWQCFFVWSKAAFAQIKMSRVDRKRARVECSSSESISEKLPEIVEDDGADDLKALESGLRDLTEQVTALQRKLATSIAETAEVRGLLLSMTSVLSAKGIIRVKK